MFIFRPIDHAAIHELLRWRYPPPYDVYNLAIAPADEAAAFNFFLDPAFAYHRIDDEYGELAAFCCFGVDAQVPGGDYSAPALDLGLGVRPDLVGRGRGSHYTTAVAQYAIDTYAPPALRVTIAAFNIRAQRAWAAAGFRETARFDADNGRPFVVLMRHLELT